jgi:hypothetical protein
VNFAVRRVPARHGTARTRVVHHVPGRLRLKLDAGPDEEVLFALLGRRLVRLPGVETVRINLAAASVVIRYDRADEGFAFRLTRDPGLAELLDFTPAVPVDPALAWRDFAVLAPLVAGTFAVMTRGGDRWMQLAALGIDALLASRDASRW